LGWLCGVVVVVVVVWCGCVVVVWLCGGLGWDRWLGIGVGWAEHWGGLGGGVRAGEMGWCMALWWAGWAGVGGGGLFP
jgi:hypothetical protein